MKVLIAVTCLLAVASAGHLGLSAYSYPYTYGAHVAAPITYASHYAGPQHLPVIGANGVPVDEPAVSSARAHHAAAHVEAKVRNGDAAVVAAGHFGSPFAYAAGHFASPVAYAAGHIGAPVVHYAGAQHTPVIGANGVPVDEPAVAVARAHHAAAHVEAKVRNGDAAVLAAGHYGSPLAYAAGHFASPVAAYAAHVAGPVAAHAVPLDTPEVAAAKSAHFAAHVEAKVRNGAFHHYSPLVHYRKRRGLFHGYAAAPFGAYAGPVAHYAGAQHIPVIGANGVPVDEPAVAVAKAEHAAAHVEAVVRNGDAAHVAVAPFAAYGAHVAGPVAHYAGPQHLPVIGANGVPVDEPAVSAARAHHAAAHVEAVVRNGDAAHVAVAPFAAYGAHVAGPVAHYAGPQHLPVIGANGVPVDEPAVSVARAHHAAAHVEAKVRNGDAAVVAAGHFASPVAYAAGHFGSPVAYAAGHFGSPVAYAAGHFGSPDAYAAGHFGSPVAYAAGHSAGPVVHYGAQHLPVIGANGVPVDEPAVSVARAHHAAAHVEAKVRNGDLHHVVAPVVHAW